jgi:hypothetical protein
VLTFSEQTQLTVCVCDMISEYGPYLEDVPSQKCIEAIRTCVEKGRFGGSSIKLTNDEMVELWHFRATIRNNRAEEIEENDEDIIVDEDDDDDTGTEEEESGSKRRRMSKGMPVRWKNTSRGHRKKRACMASLILFLPFFLLITCCCFFCTIMQSISF